MATAQREQRHDLAFSVELDGQAPDSLRLTEFTWEEYPSDLYHCTATPSPAATPISTSTTASTAR